MSFNSFMVRYHSGELVLDFFKKLSKGLLGIEIFLARDGPISVESSLNFLAVSVSKVIYFLCGKVKHELRLRVQIHELRVLIHELED